MSRYRCATSIGIAILLVSMCRNGFCASDPAELLERMKTADGGSAVDVAGLKPWHLKLTVQLFDDKGKPTDQGMIEEWWNSAESDRREYSTHGYTATELRSAGKLYRTKGAGSPPYYLELLREQAVHPVPKYDPVTGTEPELRKQTFGKAQLDCIMLSQPLKKFGFLPLGLFPTYCFDTGKDTLRASFDFGNQLVVRNATGVFQNRNVATKVGVMLGAVVVARSEIVTLETFSPAPDLPTPSDEFVERNPNVVSVSSGVMAGVILSRSDPIYPVSAKLSRMTGTVVLHAVIGTDGHVHSLKLISTPDPDLAISAIAAVRTWVYKPYMLMGVPTDVETTITVKYAMGN